MNVISVSVILASVIMVIVMEPYFHFRFNFDEISRVVSVIWVSVIWGNVIMVIVVAPYFHFRFNFVKISKVKLDWNCILMQNWQQPISQRTLTINLLYIF